MLTHYTLVACDSSTQDIAAGDKPLGLLSALLYARAASVLGCLWPIDSEAGRIFGRKFYSFSQGPDDDTVLVSRAKNVDSRCSLA